MLIKESRILKQRMPDAQKKIYEDLSLSNKEIAKLVGVHYTAVWKWRKKNMNTSESKVITQRRRFSEKDIRIMRDTSLNNREVADRLGRTIGSIKFSRNKYLTLEERSYRKNGISTLVSDNYNNRKDYTVGEIKEIVNSTMNNKEISAMFSRTVPAIADVKRRYKHMKED